MRIERDFGTPPREYARDVEAIVGSDVIGSGENREHVVTLTVGVVVLAMPREAARELAAMLTRAAGE